jgi:hypothetical protein
MRLDVRPTLYGRVGTVFADPGLEVVWVSKQAEDVDPGWFSQRTTDVLAACSPNLPAAVAAMQAGGRPARKPSRARLPGWPKATRRGARDGSSVASRV